ncbi:hypothetical protein C5S30_05060 [ANME-1 cluster archaeon GoMg4]|nr:hypothetical protein [ANME-1 cluster archaeon GoMg4]
MRIKINSPGKATINPPKRLKGMIAVILGCRGERDKHRSSFLSFSVYFLIVNKISSMEKNFYPILRINIVKVIKT